MANNYPKQHMAKLLLMMLLAIFTLPSVAETYPGYTSAEEAMKRDWKVNAIRTMAKKEGFSLSSETIDPIYYIISPSEKVYHSHTGKIVYTRKSGGEWSLQTDYLIATVEIYYNQYEGRYTINKVVTEEKTVY